MLLRGYLIWGLLVLVAFATIAGSGARLSRGDSSSTGQSGGHWFGFHSTSGWSWGK